MTVIFENNKYEVYFLAAQFLLVALITHPNLTQSCYNTFFSVIRNSHIKKKKKKKKKKKNQNKTKPRGI